MYIDGARRTDIVTTDRIMDETTRWGIGRRTVENIMKNILDRAEAAISMARDETDGVPEALVETVREQLERLTTNH
jgi:hypothetical protein